MLETCEDRTVPSAVVTIESLGDTIEGSDTVFRFTRSDTSGSLFVSYSIGGTATPSVDHNKSSTGFISFANGVAIADLTITTTDDSESEPTETIIVTVEPDSGYTVGAQSIATAYIYDNDAQIISLSSADAFEGGANGLFRFHRIGDLSGSLTVNFTVGGTATTGTDYTAIGTSVNFAALASFADKVVVALPDNLVEDPEYVQATLATGTGYSIGSPNYSLVFIHDDPPVVGVENLADGVEDVSNGAFRFSRTGGDITGSITIYYSIGGTATPGEDYTTLAGSVVIAANNSYADVTVTVLDDEETEYDEAVIVEIISSTPNYKISEDSAAMVSIADTETPLVSLHAYGDALEGVWDGSFVLVRRGDLSSSLTVNFSVSGTATSGTDFTALGSTVAFAAGDWYVFLPVEALADETFDPDETVTVTLQTGTGYVRDTDHEATITIEDAFPVVSVEKVADAWEDGREGVFRFTRTGDLTDPLTVYYTISGDATEDEDYDELTGEVEFEEGQAEVFVVIVPIDDEDDDPGEVVTLTIDSDSEYEVGAADEASLMVVDDETPLVSVVKIADAFEGGANGMFRFTRTGDTSSSLAISYTITGTATAGTDYTALTGSATFAADEDFVDVPVALLSDSSAEDTETVIVRVNSGVDYGAHPDAIDVVYVFDDDTEEGIIGGVVWFDEDEDGIRDSLEEVAAGYTVTLRDEWGYRIAETLTDSYGAYSFRGLPEATYCVSVLPPLLHWFTDADAGTDDTIDSDMDVETGWSVPILLSEGNMTSTNVGGGIRMVAMASLPDKSVVFTYKDGSIVGTNQHLRIATWHDAFEADPVTKLPRVRQQGTLEGLGDGFDFIDHDNDRFNIRVKDVELWNQMDNGSPVKPTIIVTLSTTNVDGYTAYDDTETKIALVRMPDQVGWYWSDSLILVSNEVDDKYSNPRYLGKDDVDVGPTTTTYKKGGWTIPISDRTHRIALGGTVTAKYTYQNEHEQNIVVTNSTTVKVDKVIKVHVTILNNKPVANGGEPVVAESTVENDIARMREIYAQAGLRVDLVFGQNEQNLSDRIKDPPNQVNLSNGLDMPVGRRGDKFVLSQEQKDLLTAYNTPPVNNKYDIEVYYVNAMKVLGEIEPRWLGFALTQSNVSELQYAYVATIASTANSYTLAHEVMHILDDRPGHFGRIPEEPTAIERTNLLVDGRFGLHRVYTVTDSRRMTPTQIERISTHVDALLYLP